MMLLTAFVAVALQAGSLPVQAEVRDGSRKNQPRSSVAAAESRGAARAQALASSRLKTAHRVIVDAGHGGIDPGAPVKSGRLQEKDITLQVSLKVGAALKQRGIDVVYTRTRDTLIARADRGRIANDANGDVFISVHVNAANPRWRRPSAARGFETYFLGVAKTEDSRRVEEMEEESARFEDGSLSTTGDPLGFIINDMLQNEHLRESADLADLVQRHLRQIHPGPDRGVKQAGFTVLVTAFMPAILVEIGFGTNAEEARFLASDSKQWALSAAIADATAEYLQRHEARVGTGSAGATAGKND